MAYIQEEWAIYPEFEGTVEISNFGNVRYKETKERCNRYISKSRDPSLYLLIRHKKTYYARSLKVMVMRTFGTLKDHHKYSIDYIDGNYNNNSINNLYYREKHAKYKQRKLEEKEKNLLKEKTVNIGRDCRKCLRYPCMDRQRKGLTNINFAREGCKQYKV